ncbi:ribose 5-phosphate isomerase B [bacterium]|nr:ribose 5-phosphate isomerase B [bacterium]
MKIAIASDHGGLSLKKEILNYLSTLSHTVQDFGCFTDDSVDYPDYAKPVAMGVAKGEFDRGILVCGTGVGISIAANKVKGIRAASVFDTETAKLTREHNNLNVLCLGGRILSVELAKEIVKIFLETPFAGGRHEGRLKKIAEMEK